MRRFIEKELLEWKSRKSRLPLIVRGARQVGKSYLIETFGKEHFSSVVTANFEYEPRLKESFQSLNPTRIVSSLEILLGQSIKAGQTLLFLDEIQECPE